MPTAQDIVLNRTEEHRSEQPGHPIPFIEHPQCTSPGWAPWEQQTRTLGGDEDLSLLSAAGSQGRVETRGGGIEKAGFVWRGGRAAAGHSRSRVGA